MQRISAQRGWAASLLFFLLAFLIGQTSVSAQSTVVVYGVTTGNQLVRFNSNAPTAVTTIGAITNLQAGENVLGIDFRPANGQLYALGSSSRLYTINTQNGAATAVGTAAFATALNGTDFGFDFNPTVDRIRVVSNTGQNLRLNPDTGGIAAVDPNLNPGTPTVTAAAYTNNFAGATTTILYDIDTASDRLVQQNPANAGTLVDVGALGVDASSANGFDISTRDNTAYAALQVGGASTFYRVNLTSGATTAVGALTGVSLRGIAIALGSTAAATLDYDGDRRTDYAVFRPNTSQFFLGRSSNNSFFGTQFGLPNDLQTPGDYDGDGLTDVSVWRDGIFYFIRSSDNSFGNFQWGISTDEPVARDFDGDRRADFAVVRRNSTSSGNLVWYIVNSSNNSVRIELFGLDSDVLAPGDYDGDGRFDLAVRRGAGNNQATFFVQQSTAGFRTADWGLGADLIAPGDYDGDGRTDFTAIRQGSNFSWFVLRSSNSTLLSAQFGIKPQLLVPGDYDGDGRTDIATWDQLNGIYFALRSSNASVLQAQFGQNGDFPIANVFAF